MKHLHTTIIVAVLHMSTMCTTESVVLGVNPRNKKDGSAKNGDTNHNKGRSSRQTSPCSNNSYRPYEDAKEEITILRENSESFSRTDSIRQVSPRDNYYTPRNESSSRLPIKSKSLSPRKRSYSNSSRSLPPIPRSRNQLFSSVGRTRGHSLDSDSLQKVQRPLKSGHHDVPTSRPRSHSEEFKDNLSNSSLSPLLFPHLKGENIWEYNSADERQSPSRRSSPQSGQQAYSTPRTLPRHRRAASWTDAQTYNSYVNQERADERQSPSRRSSPQSGQQAYSTPRTLPRHRRAASCDYTPERRHPSGNQAQIRIYFQQQPYTPPPIHVVWLPVAYSPQTYYPIHSPQPYCPIHSPQTYYPIHSPQPHNIPLRKFFFPTQLPSSEERRDNARPDSTQARSQQDDDPRHLDE